jgi:hypothetical protein
VQADIRFRFGGGGAGSLVELRSAKIPIFPKRPVFRGKKCASHRSFLFASQRRCLPIGLTCEELFVDVKRFQEVGRQFEAD